MHIKGSSARSGQRNNGIVETESIFTRTRVPTLTWQYQNISYEATKP